MLMNNNRPHRADLVDDFLFEEGIIQLEWPAYYAGMNQIEKNDFGNNLGKLVADCLPSPRTLQELEITFEGMQQNTPALHY